MKKVFTIYLKNFRVIHHIVFTSATFGILEMSSFIFPQNQLLFKLDSLSTLLQIIILFFCCYLNEIALNKAGITDEFMKCKLENFLKSQSQIKKSNEKDDVKL